MRSLPGRVRALVWTSSSPVSTTSTIAWQRCRFGQCVTALPDDRGIAFVVAGLGAGGAERVIAMLASAWVRSGRHVTVFAFDLETDPVYHDFDPRIRLVRLGGAGAPRGVFAVIGRVRRLRAALLGLQPGIVISFLTKINAVTLLATLGTGLPAIVCERNNPRRQAAHPAWQVLLHRLYRRAAAIVIQTEASRECLPAAVAPRAVVIANPIAPCTRAAVPADARPQTLVAVGRLEAQKGFDRLLTAFARVAPGNPDWRLIIWGEGPRRADLEGQAAALGLGRQFALPGLSPTPQGWLASAGVFVLSSHHEGFPNALGEAMAAGLPVIAFDCAYGPAEMIETGVSGLLVADGDTSGFAEGLQALMRQPALRARLAGAAGASMARFDPERILALWTDLVARVSRGASE